MWSKVKRLKRNFVEKDVIEREREEEEVYERKINQCHGSRKRERKTNTERGKYFGVVGFKVLLCVTEPCR